MAASSIFGALQFVWCGMRVPNGFYSRTAFLFTFLLIWTAAYYLYAHATANNTKKETAHAPVAPIAKNAALTALLLLVCVDLGLSAHSAWGKIYYNYTQEQHNAYVEEADVRSFQIKQVTRTPLRQRRTVESAPRSTRASRTASTSSRPIRPQTPPPPYGSSTAWDIAASGSSQPSMLRPCWQWIVCLACATSAPGERPQDTARPASKPQVTAPPFHWPPNIRAFPRHKRRCKQQPRHPQWG